MDQMCIRDRLFAAGAPASILAIARQGSAIIEEKPVSPGEIARRARVLVHAGNHGMSCLGIRAGLPQVTIGEAPEHIFDGRQLAAQGIGLTVEPRRRTVPNIKAAIAEAWESVEMAARAVAYAQETAPEFAGDPGELTADRIEAVLH